MIKIKLTGFINRVVKNKNSIRVFIFSDKNLGDLIIGVNKLESDFYDKLIINRKYEIIVKLTGNTSKSKFIYNHLMLMEYKEV